MRVCWLIVLAALSMAHVGSADAFFTGKAGPYDVRVTVRLPGVIPGRAQVAVRLVGASAAANPQVTLQAAQWNVGLTGAPPPEPAVAVPGSPRSVRRGAVADDGVVVSAGRPRDWRGWIGNGNRSGHGDCDRRAPMPPWLGWALAGLGLFLTVGFMTIIGSAVRESVLPPGVEPDSRRRTRARIGIAVAALAAGLLLWGGNVWWAAEASGYSRRRALSPICCRGAGNRAGREATAHAGDSRPAVDRHAESGKPL